MDPKEKENIQEEELQQQATADEGAEEQASGNATEKEEVPVSEEEKLTQELEAANAAKRCSAYNSANGSLNALSAR